MKELKFDSQEEWLAARRGKITGTRLKDITLKRGEGKKIGFYELIAERLAVESDGEDPMERGLRLEEEAIARFVEVTDKIVDTSLVIWTRDDNANIAISPDGIVDVEEAVEIKCLSSARHIEALLTQHIPDEYHFQVLQYFIVNDLLQTLNFCFYDPRIGFGKEFFTITVSRESVQDEVEEYLAHERQVLSEIEEIVTNLTF